MVWTTAAAAETALYADTGRAIYSPNVILCVGTEASTGAAFGTACTAIVKFRSLKAPSGSVMRTVKVRSPTPAAVHCSRPPADTTAPAGPLTSVKASASAASSASAVASWIDPASPATSDEHTYEPQSLN